MKWTDKSLFRVRGKYKGSKREGWVTKSWKLSKESAELDKRVFGDNFTNVKIIERKVGSFIDEINSGKRKRLPKYSW